MKRNRASLLISIIVFGGVLVFVEVCRLTGITDKVWIDTGTLISAAMAIFALIVSILTLTSIDSVNSISRMEGNVLENDGYRTNLYRLIFDLKHERERKRKEAFAKFTEDDFIRIIEKPYKCKITSGTQLADNLQQTIDYLVLLPYFIIQSDKKEADKIQLELKIDRLVDLIETKVKKFEHINAGSNILIVESFNLIQATIYQQFRERLPENRIRHMVLMPAIRGTMLKNPISKVVYHDYLGLFYMTKAKNILETIINEKVDSVSGLEKCCHESGNAPKIVIDYFENAKEHFKTALSVIGSDVMWNAFIRYNLARVNVYLLCLSGGKKEPNIFDECIEYRHRLNLFLDDLFEEYSNDKDVVFFKNAFVAEELLASLFKICCEIAFSSDKKVSVDNSVLTKAHAAITAGNDYGLLNGLYYDIVSNTETT